MLGFQVCITITYKIHLFSAIIFCYKIELIIFHMYVCGLCVHMLACMWCVHAHVHVCGCMWTCMLTCMWAPVSVHVCYVCLHMCGYMQVCMFICVGTCRYAFLHVYGYACLSLRLVSGVFFSHLYFILWGRVSPVNPRACQYSCWYASLPSEIIGRPPHSLHLDEFWIESSIFSILTTKSSLQTPFYSLF